MQKYRNMTAAEALFFHSSVDRPGHQLERLRGLRVLLPDKGLEFSDGSFIGTDPAGFFYYHNLEEVKGAIRYESGTIVNPQNDQLCAWVKFFNPSNKLVGEFLGDDFFHAVDVAGMNGHAHAGQWGFSSANSLVEAHLKKGPMSTTMTLDISNAIKKVATMTTVDADLIVSSLSDISGRFHYGSWDNISNGTYVSYTNDRLVFYHDDKYGSPTFTGYFIPNGRSDSPTILGIQGSTELTLSGTVWT